MTLAAIQGLLELVKEKDARIVALEDELAARDSARAGEIAALRDLVFTMKEAMAEQEARIRVVETKEEIVLPDALQASLQD